METMGSEEESENEQSLLDSIQVENEDGMITGSF